MRGEITCSVRIWQSPHVKVGGRYRLGEGAIEVTSIREISMEDITQDILNSPVPVMVYVSPHGAWAASAGVFITYAAHVAVMAPGSSPSSGASHSFFVIIPVRPSPSQVARLTPNIVAVILFDSRPRSLCNS